MSSHRYIHTQSQVMYALYIGSIYICCDVCVFVCACLHKCCVHFHKKKERKTKRKKCEWKKSRREAERWNLFMCIAGVGFLLLMLFLLLFLPGPFSSSYLFFIDFAKMYFICVSRTWIFFFPRFILFFSLPNCLERIHLNLFIFIHFSANEFRIRMYWTLCCFKFGFSFSFFSLSLVLN